MVEMDLHISKRLKACLPPLTDEQKKGLEDDILADGRVTDPILYWHDGKRNVVIDGMHRWEIIRRNGVTQFRTEPMPTAGESYEDIEEWIWKRAKHQRNMTREQIGEWYNNMKSARGGNRRIKVSNDTLKNAAEHISEATGKSVSTVKRDGKRAENIGKLDISLRKAVNANAVKVTDDQLAKLVKAPATKQEKVRSLVLKENMTTDAAMRRIGLIKGPVGQPETTFPGAADSDADDKPSEWDNIRASLRPRIEELKTPKKVRVALSEYNMDQQEEIVNLVNDDSVKMIADAISMYEGEGLPESPISPPTRSSSRKETDKKALWKQYDQLHGQIRRLTDKIGKEINQHNGQQHRKILKELSTAADLVRMWLGIS